MLLTPKRRLPRNDMDSPFAMDILGQDPHWRVSSSPAARYRASSPIFSPVSPAPPKETPPPTPPAPTASPRLPRRLPPSMPHIAKEPPPPAPPRPPPMPDGPEQARRRLTMNAIARAARRRDGARVVGNAMRRISTKPRDSAFHRWRVASVDEQREEQTARSDKVSTLLQAVRQLEGRLAAALASRDVNAAGATRLAAIVRTRARRALQNAWLSLRAQQYVALDVAAYRGLEKERRGARDRADAADAARAARAAAERNNANIVEDARAQLDAAEAQRSTLVDCMEESRKELDAVGNQMEAAVDAAEDATRIAIERAERISVLEAEISDAKGLAVARSELEQRLARERDDAQRERDDAKRERDDARLALTEAAKRADEAVEEKRVQVANLRRRLALEGDEFCEKLEARTRDVAKAADHHAEALRRERDNFERREASLSEAGAKAMERLIKAIEDARRERQARVTAEAEVASARSRAAEVAAERIVLANELVASARSCEAARAEQQQRALETLRKCRASRALGHWRHRAAGKRRQSLALAALAKKRAAAMLARWHHRAAERAQTRNAARRIARCLRAWLHCGTNRAFCRWRRTASAERTLEYVGRARSAGQAEPDVRRLSSAVSNVDGFTLVEGEATPLTFKGRPMLRVTALFEGEGGRGRHPRAGDTGRPLDTIANLARTSLRTPRPTRTPRAQTAGVRRTWGEEYLLPSRR